MPIAWFQPSLRRIHRPLLASVVYIVLFLAFDQFAAIFETESIVSLWYPSAGLSIALVLGFGPACAPALILANLFSLSLHYKLPLDWSVLSISLAHGLFYSAAGMALRRLLHSKRIDTVQAISRCLAISLLASVPLALVAGLALVLDGELAWSAYPHAAFEWWLGDQIGIVVIVPLLLVSVFPRLQIWGSRTEPLLPVSLTGWVELSGQAASIVGTLWIVFLSPFALQRPLYICFLPLIWIVLRSGLSGATLAISSLSFGAMIAMSQELTPVNGLIDLQLFMLAIALTGLLLGASVSEQRYTASALQSSEARARAIVQDQTDLVCRYRSDTTLTFVNEAYCQFFGRTAESLIGQSFMWMARTEYHATIRQQIAILIATHEPMIDESLIYRGDGSLRWMQWVNRLIADTDGQTVEIQVVGRDITERRRAEEAYRSLVDQSLQGLAIVQHGHVVFVNPAFCAMAGYTSEELLALPDPTEIIDLEDRKRIIELAVTLPPDRDLRSIEVRANRKDGHQRWLQVFLTETNYDNLSALMVMAIDITQRKEAEVARQQAEERYRMISQMTSDYSYLYSMHPDGVMRRDWLAGAFTRITGYELEEFDRIGGWNAIVLPTDLPQVLSGRVLTAQGIPCEIEVRIQCRDGSIRWLRNAMRPEHDPQTGKFLRVYGAVQDISERKQAEETRRAIDRQIQETQKLESIGLLAGGIAHDFNNLLVGVLGNAGLALAELPDDAPARVSVRQIEIAANHAADLTRQLLAYAGKSRVVVQRLHVNPLIEEMIQLLHVGVPRQVELTSVMGADLPEIEGDVSQLRQVLMNIVINAAEAIGADPGVITIMTDARWIDRTMLSDAYLGSDLPEQLYVVIEVTDTGCGMDVATCARIFEPFFTTKFTGRGLGLAAVLGIVRSHQGALKITSVPGQGSTFTILLPSAVAHSLEPTLLLEGHNRAFN